MGSKNVWWIALAACACSSNTPVFSGDDGGVSAPDGRMPVIDPPVYTELDETCATAMTDPFDDTLPVLTVEIVGDDNTAFVHASAGDVDRVEGMRVCWGSSVSELSHASLFAGLRGQLFGVANGGSYVAIVQAVDARGRISRPSEPISFSGDGERVAQLRREMTGFFDDFNLSQGDLDQTRWNIAYSKQDPTATATFIGPHQHAVSMLATTSQLPGSRSTEGLAQNTARPRAIFDFTDREGRIVFDLDGAEGGRHTWYLDVIPAATREETLDITAHKTFDPGEGYPGRFLRFAQSGDTLIINQHDANGDPIHEERGGVPHGLSPGELMRHFEIRVSNDYAAIYVDGELAVENGEIDLDYERGILHWAQFGYNLLKMERPWSTMMWDNFGFDGPPSIVRTHNYLAAFNGPDYEMTRGTTIAIPDSLDGAVGARFFYTFDDATLEPGDQIAINGTVFPIEQPPTEFRPYSTSFEVPMEVLRTGENSIEVTTSSAVILNMHVEVDFDPSDAPAYTQPSAVLGTTPLLELPEVGPDAYIAAINGEVSGPFALTRGEVASMVAGGYPDVPIFQWRSTLSGIVRVNASAHCARMTNAYRRNLGIARVELLVDGVAYAAIDTAESVPAPRIAGGLDTNTTQPFETPLDFTLDTTTLSNGLHELEVRAYDSTGNYGRLLTPYVSPLINVDVQN
jgi:hypothetical protein